MWVLVLFPFLSPIGSQFGRLKFQFSDHIKTSKTQHTNKKEHVPRTTIRPSSSPTISLTTVSHRPTKQLTNQDEQQWAMNSPPPSSPPNKSLPRTSFSASCVALSAASPLPRNSGTWKRRKNRWVNSPN